MSTGYNTIHITFYYTRAYASRLFLPIRFCRPHHWSVWTMSLLLLWLPPSSTQLVLDALTSISRSYTTRVHMYSYFIWLELHTHTHTLSTQTVVVLCLNRRFVVWASVAVHTCNPNTREAREGTSPQLCGHLGLSRCFKRKKVFGLNSLTAIL